MNINKILAISLMCSGLLLGIVPRGIVVDAAGVPSKLEVVIAPNPIIAEGSEQEYGNSNGVIFVSLQDSLGRPVQASREIALEVSSSDLGVGSIPRGPWKIAKDDYYVRVDFSCTFFFIFEPRFTNTFRFGSTTITASADGLTSGQAVLTTVPQGGNSSRLKTYAGVPKIPVSAKFAPIQVQVLDSEGTPTKPTTSFEVTLSASPDIVEFNSRSWRWGRDFADYVSYMGDYVIGKAVGFTKLTASASGLTSDSGTIEVVPSDITNTALISGRFASSLIVLLYLSLPVTGVLWLLRRRVDARTARRITKSLVILMAIFLAGFTVSQLLLVPPLVMFATAGMVLTALPFGSILPALLIMKK